MIGKNWSNLDRKIIIKVGSNYNNWSNLQQKYWSNLDQTIWTKFRLMYFNQILKKYWIVELMINNVSLGYLCCYLFLLYSIKRLIVSIDQKETLDCDILIKWYYPEGIDWIYTKKHCWICIRILNKFCVSLIYIPTFS